MEYPAVVAELALQQVGGEEEEDSDEDSPKP